MNQIQQGDLIEVKSLWAPILNSIGIIIETDPFGRIQTKKPVHHKVLVKGKIWLLKEGHMKVLSIQNVARRPSSNK